MASKSSDNWSYNLPCFIPCFLTTNDNNNLKQQYSHQFICEHLCSAHSMETIIVGSCCYMISLSCICTLQEKESIWFLKARRQSRPNSLTLSSCYTAQVIMGPRKKKQSRYRSVISDIFDGSILSLVQCLTCDRVSGLMYFVFQPAGGIMTITQVNQTLNGSLLFHSDMAKFLNVAVDWF